MLTMQTGLYYHTNPIAAYSQNHDARPPIDKLTSWHNQMADTDSLRTMLIAADVCLDLASSDERPEQRQEWVQAASEHLYDVIDMGERLKSYNNTQSFGNEAPRIAKALMRRAELSNWSQAVAGEEVETNYCEALAAGKLMMPLMADHRIIWPYVAEFIPVILGQRAAHNSGGEDGWTGRLALFREDQGRDFGSDINPNWDAGVSYGQTSAEFIDPTVKTQVKLTRHRGVAKYLRAGIVSISARDCGFNNPASIIAGCLLEQDMDFGSKADMIEAYHPKQLDDITNSISSVLNTSPSAKSRLQAE